jgi:phosphoesterase RecJ-like protein
MKKVLREVIQALKNSRRVLICSHIEPDGDSIGSQLAMAVLLEDMGKETAIVNQDPVPSRYLFLDPDRRIHAQPPVDFQPDTVVLLDCSKQDRIGETRRYITDDLAVITIDHHPGVPQPRGPAYLDVEASSTGELIVDIIEELNLTIGPAQADQLYTAIVSDTGGFRFPNTTAKSLAAAARLAARGARPYDIAVKIYEQRSVASLRLLSRALGKLIMYEGDRVSLVCLVPDDMEACRAGQEEVDGIVDFLVAMKTVEAGVLMRQLPSGIIKVNLRTRMDVKANKIAEAMGGGGHPNAAGYRTRLPLDQAKDELLREICKHL